MKKVFVFLALVLILSVCCVSTAMMENQPDSIVFRNIPWLTYLDEAQDILEQEKDLSPKKYAIKENETIPDWDDAGNLFNISNQNTGVSLKYSSKVAGYRFVGW